MTFRAAHDARRQFAGSTGLTLDRIKITANTEPVRVFTIADDLVAAITSNF